MTPAEATFRSVTEAAYEVFANSPPAISYRIVAQERDPIHGFRNIRYDEIYDTRTAIARRHDLTFGDWKDERPLVAAPNLDPIGTFTSFVQVEPQAFVFTAFSVAPLKLTAPVAPIGFDVWTAANAAYIARFDDADTTQTTLLLTPTNAYRSAYKGWKLARLRFDPATKLPRVVEMTGDDGGRFRLEYKTVAGHHVLAAASLDQDADTFVNGARISNRLHVHVDATYDNYAFPSPAPDASPAPSKAPS